MTLDVNQAIGKAEIGIPQEAVTGELLRGRGPRRGNLEALLRYWRPIMKKPGGFRRCVVTLADHPELYPPQRLCAWLHHELTGKWPNEGNHHGRGRRTARRILSKDATADAILNDPISVNTIFDLARESRYIDGLLLTPSLGSQNTIDFKAACVANLLSKKSMSTINVKRVGAFGSNSRVGQSLQGVASTLIPGDSSSVRSPIRSQIYETLTPGGGKDRDVSSRIPRRLISTGRRGGRGVRNRFRCPPGFEKGGTFTDSAFTTCGAQVLAVPAAGPGALSSGALRALARLARDADVVRDIGDLRSNRSAFDIIRAAQIPVAPKKGSPTLREQSVNNVLEALQTQAFDSRVVRRDGVILEPLLSLQALSAMNEFDDLADGSFVQKYADGQIAADLMPVFSTGLRDIYSVIPEAGVVKVTRVGGALSEVDMAKLRREFPAALRRYSTSADPSAAIRSFADSSDGKYIVEFGRLANEAYLKNDADNTLIRVVTGSGAPITVPKWVYETFLSRSAPRRPKSSPIYEVVADDRKSVDFGFYKTKASITSAVAAKPERDLGFLKATRFSSVSTKVSGTSGRAFWDPNVKRFRCPPGTRYGGRITNRLGSNCGYRLPDDIVDNLVNTANQLDNAEKLIRSSSPSPSKPIILDGKPGLDARGKQKEGKAALMQFLEELDNTIEKVEKSRPGALGPTLSDMNERADLTPEERELLQGNSFLDALENYEKVLNASEFAEATLDDIKEAFSGVERASNLEAGRLTDSPPRSEEDKSLAFRIGEAIGRILNRIQKAIQDFIDGYRSARAEQSDNARLRRQRNTRNVGRPSIPTDGMRPLPNNGMRPRLVIPPEDRLPGNRRDDDAVAVAIDRLKVDNIVDIMKDLRPADRDKFLEALSEEELNAAIKRFNQDGANGREFSNFEKRLIGRARSRARLLKRRREIRDGLYEPGGRGRGRDRQIGDGVVTPSDVALIDELMALSANYRTGQTGDFVRDLSDDDLVKYLDALDRVDNAVGLDEALKIVRNRMRNDRERRGLNKRGASADSIIQKDLDNLQELMKLSKQFGTGQTGDFIESLSDVDLERFQASLNRINLALGLDEGLSSILDRLELDRARRYPRRDVRFNGLFKNLTNAQRSNLTRAVSDELMDMDNEFRAKFGIPDNLAVTELDLRRAFRENMNADNSETRRMQRFLQDFRELRNLNSKIGIELFHNNEINSANVNNFIDEALVDHVGRLAPNRFTSIMRRRFEGIAPEDIQPNLGSTPDGSPSAPNAPNVPGGTPNLPNAPGGAVTPNNGLNTAQVNELAVGLVADIIADRNNPLMDNEIDNIMRFARRQDRNNLQLLINSVYNLDTSDPALANNHAELYVPLVSLKLAMVLDESDRFDNDQGRRLHALMGMSNSELALLSRLRDDDFLVRRALGVDGPEALKLARASYNDRLSAFLLSGQKNFTNGIDLTTMDKNKFDDFNDAFLDIQELTNHGNIGSLIFDDIDRNNRNGIAAMYNLWPVDMLSDFKNYHDRLQGKLDLMNRSSTDPDEMIMVRSVEDFVDKNANLALQVREITDLRDRFELDKPVADRSLLALNNHIAYIENGGVPPLGSDAAPLIAARDNLGQIQQQAAQAVAQVAVGNPNVGRKLRDLITTNWKRYREEKVKYRNEKMLDVLIDRYRNGETPWVLKGRVNNRDVSGYSAFKTLSSAEQENYLRTAFSHGVEIPLGEQEYNGFRYRKSLTPDIVRVYIGGSSDNPLNDASVSGHFKFKVEKLDADGNVVKVFEDSGSRGFPTNTIKRTFNGVGGRNGNVHHDYLGITRTFDPDTESWDTDSGIRFNDGGGLATTLNSHAFAFYRELGIKKVEVYAANDGIAAWPAQGFRPDERSSLVALNSDDGIGSLIADYKNYKDALSNGQRPTTEQIQARIIIGDDRRFENVSKLYEVGKEAIRARRGVNEIPGQFDYLSALNPVDADGKIGRNLAAFNYFKGTMFAVPTEPYKAAIPEIEAELGYKIGDTSGEWPPRGQYLTGLWNAATFTSGVLDIGGLKRVTQTALDRRRRDNETIPGRTPGRIDFDRFIATRINPNYRRILAPHNDGPAVFDNGVAVGAYGINNQQLANDAVLAGKPLSQIPDDFITDAIAAGLGLGPDQSLGDFGYPGMEGTRFKLISNGGGVNATYLFKDKNTDHMFGLKFADGEAYFAHEDFNESLGADIAERFGFLQGQIRFAGPALMDDTLANGGGYYQYAVRPIVFELAQNYYDPDQLVSPTTFGALDNVSEKEKMQSLMFDALIFNTDRHYGNYLILEDPSGNNVSHIVNFDHGVAFTGNDTDITRSAESRFREVRMTHHPSVSLRGFGRTDADKQRVIGHIAEIQERLKAENRRQSFVEAYEDAMQRMYAHRGSDGSGIPDTVKYGLEVYKQNLEFLLTQSPEYIYSVLIG